MTPEMRATRRIERRLVTQQTRLQRLYEERDQQRIAIARAGIRAAMLAYLRATRTDESQALSDAWVGMLRAHNALRDVRLDLACEADS